MMDKVRMKEFLKNKNNKEFEYHKLKWKLESQKREIEQRQEDNDRRMKDLHQDMMYSNSVNHNNLTKPNNAQ